MKDNIDPVGDNHQDQESPQPEINLRKHRLFKLLVYSAVCNPPNELWANHRPEVEALKKDIGDTWESTNWFNLGIKYGEGALYQWTKIQAREIWEFGTNPWYEKEVEPWLERANINW